MKCTVIIPAGGTGLRFGGDMPKQFIELAGKPIIVHTIEIFQQIDEVNDIIISVHKEWLNHANKLVKEYKLDKVSNVIEGGLTRQDSVWNALNMMKSAPEDIVLIHDAARPFASANLVKKIINGIKEYGACIPFVKPVDTVKRLHGNLVSRTLDRSKLANVQTPQGFHYEALKDAYITAHYEDYLGTDDASLVEFSGKPVKVVEGEDNNIKITTKFDFKVAELIFNS